MKFRNLLPIYLLAASPLFIACESDDDNDDDSSSGTSTTCSTVISSSDAPQTNDLFVLIEAKTDQVNVDSLVSINGSDKTWDFSELTADTDSDSIHFKSATSGSAYSSYSDADFVFMSSDDDSELYFKVKSNGLDVIGINSDEDDEVSIEVTNSVSFIPYTLEMGKTIKDAFVLTATSKDTIDTIISGMTFTDQPIVIEVTQTNENDYNVDGCGTVITPFGTYECLRYVAEPGEEVLEGTISGNSAQLGGDFSLAIPSAQLDDEEIDFNVIEAKTYYWINKETKFPVLIVTVDASGQVDDVQYLKD